MFCTIKQRVTSLHCILDDARVELMLTLDLLSIVRTYMYRRQLIMQGAACALFHAVYILSRIHHVDAFQD